MTRSTKTTATTIHTAVLHMYNRESIVAIIVGIVVVVIGGGSSCLIIEVVERGRYQWRMGEENIVLANISIASTSSWKSYFRSPIMRTRIVVIRAITTSIIICGI